MNTDELLTKLETWPIGSTAHNYPTVVREVVPLMTAAAAEIRQLRTAENDLASILDDYQTGQKQSIREPQTENHRDMT